MNTHGLPGDGVVYWANIDLSNVQYADFSKVQYSVPVDSDVEDAYDEGGQGKATYFYRIPCV